jgi:branched-subunit amino acid aminotransferase/4-amino-4-deoxychorismate lyase
MSFALLSSTRYDPFLENLKWNNNKDGSGSPFLLLHYHLDRLRVAARKHGWAEAVNALSWHAFRSECYRVVQAFPEAERPAACKIRIVLTESGALTATATSVKPFTSDPTSASFFKPDTDNHSLFGSPLRIQVDSEPTPTSIFTTTKTTNRAVYDTARVRTGVVSLLLPLSPPPSDVLLYNSRNAITEASIYNVAFYRSKRWLTPPVSTGCLPGVLRRWLLEQGRIFEADENLLTKESIVEGECVLLMNGVQGCQLGKVILPTPPSQEDQ